MTPSKRRTPPAAPAEARKAMPSSPPAALLKEVQALGEGAPREQERRALRARPCCERQYAVKLVQGTAPRLSDNSFIAPGRYFTAINVHNPSTCRTVTFRWKVALADLGGQTVSTITPFREATLRPDGALEIDARLIARAFGAKSATFAKGFVVLESPCDLDVVAVYTVIPAVSSAAAASAAVAFHTERVPARKITGCQDLDLDISTGVAEWTIISSAMPALNAVPCPAVVIPDSQVLQSPQWAVQPGSRWISARGGVNAGDPFTGGWYVFQYCFTLCSGFTNPALEVSILVDDGVLLQFNGQFIPPVVVGNLGGPPQTATVTSGFLPGRNCLQLWVYNGFNAHKPNPVGINLLGRMTAERGACPEGCGCGC